MPDLTTDDGVRLYYEESGSGLPLVFVHEFADDCRGYEPQMRYFSRRYRCIAYNARGYPPSAVPANDADYSQDRARDDIRSVMDGLGIDRAHVVGVSMGGFATLHFGLHYPDRALSLTVGGCGYGAKPDQREGFKAETATMADRLATESMTAVAADYTLGPTRVQFQNKDPRGWQEFADRMAEHSSEGSSRTMRGVQQARPSLYDLADALGDLTVPTLIINGDEDEPCLDAGLFLKRTVPSAALVMLPQTGHAVNLEEPALFNQLVQDFLHQVESGGWRLRDSRSLGTGALGGSGR